MEPFALTVIIPSPLLTPNHCQLLEKTKQATTAHSPPITVCWNDPDRLTTFYSGQKWAVATWTPRCTHLNDTSLGLPKRLPLPAVTGPLTWGSPVDFRTLMWAVSGGCAGIPDAWYPFTAGTETLLRC